MSKFCKDCVHYRAHDGGWTSLDSCAHPLLPGKIDLVRGEPLDRHCIDVRSSQGKCGPAALLFEAAADPRSTRERDPTNEAEPRRQPDIDQYADDQRHDQCRNGRFVP